MHDLLTIARIRVHSAMADEATVYRRQAGESATWLYGDPAQTVSDPALAAALDLVAGLSAPPIVK